MENDYNVAELFFKACSRHPDKLAIVQKAATITFAELEIQVMETAQYLTQKKVGIGDRVLVLVPMGINLYSCVIAILAVGATVVFIDEWAGIKRLKVCCKKVPCKAVVGSWKVRWLARILPGLRSIPIKLHSQIPKQNQEGFKLSTLAIQSDSAALITFTTGSTGIPKAAIRTHSHLYYQYSALQELLMPTVDEVYMTVLPIVLLINLGSGCTSVIADWDSKKPDQMDAGKVVAQMARYDVSSLAASPFFVSKLAGYFMENPKIAMPLTKIFTGGAAVFPAEAKQWKQAFPKTDTTIVYGSTEAEPISSISIAELLVKEHDSFSFGVPVGRPHAVASVKIIPYNPAPIIMATEQKLLRHSIENTEPGEIIVSGKHVLEAYANDAQAIVENKIIIGNTTWHRTGDCGRMDEKGMLYLLGRCNGIFTWKGQLIAPFLHEQRLQALDGIRLGTILKLKEKLIAAIEPTNSLGKEAIAKAIREEDGEITEVLFVDKMPRDPRHNSKIDYGKLREMLLKMV